MPAVILNHTAHEVKLHDPRDPPVMVRVDPVEPQYTPPTVEDWDRLEALTGLGNLMAKYGAARVMTWVRNLAAINGEDV